MATGGLSYPAVGTDGMGHSFLSKLGHTIKPTYPALTPLLGPHPGGEKLPGISLDVVASVKGIHSKKTVEAQRTGFLFTHRGYSGPAILDVSHLLVKSMEGIENVQPQLLLNWCGEDPSFWRETMIKQRSKALLSNWLSRFMPERLASALCKEAGLQSKSVAELTIEERERLIELLTCYPLPVKGHAGYKMAEVTGGGVSLEEIKTSSMESKKHPGLYVCGEVVDVFGRIGGFNFYWAWLSGRLAGIGSAK